MQNRDMGAGRVLALFVWVAVDREIDEIRADAAIIEQRVALARSAIADDTLAGALSPNQKREQRTLGLAYPFGEGRIGCKLPESRPLFQCEQLAGPRAHRL